MKKIIAIFSALVICISVLSSAGIVLADEAISAHVYTIITNPAENSNTAMNIGWHADFGYEDCYVWYTLKSDTAWNNAQRVNGTFDADDYLVFYDRLSVNKSGVTFIEQPEFLNYGATVSSLTPDTDYMYKIADGKGGFSKVYNFKTGGAEKYSFIWLSDTHAYASMPLRTTNTVNTFNYALTQAKYDVNYLFYTGDMMVIGGCYSHWKLFYETQIFNDYMIANVVGNHDVIDKYYSDDVNDERGRVTSDYFKVANNMPKNAYVGSTGVDANGSSYWYMYGDALFIMFDYYSMWKYDADWKDGFAWGGKVIESLKGQYKYLIVANHLNCFNGGGGDDRFYWRYRAFCDKYNVDLVCCGDNHIYTRTPSLYDGSVSTDPEKGTYFVTCPTTDGTRGNSAVAPGAAGYLVSQYSIGTATIGGFVVDVDERGMTFTLVVKENGAYRNFETFNIPIKYRPKDLSTGYYRLTADTELKSSPTNEAQKLLTVASGTLVEATAANGDWVRFRYNGYTGWARPNSPEYIGEPKTPANVEMFKVDNVLGKSGTFSWSAPLQLFLPSFGDTVAYGANTFKYQTMIVADLNPETFAYSVNAFINDDSVKNTTAIPKSGCVVSFGSSYANLAKITSALAKGKQFTFDSFIGALYPCTPGEANPVIKDPNVKDKIEIKAEYSSYTIDSNGYLLGTVERIAVSELEKIFDNEKISVTSGKDSLPLEDTAFVGTGATINCLDESGNILDTVTVIVLGDTDGNGVVDTTDFLQIKRHFQKSRILSGIELIAANVSATDDIINTTDFLRVKRHFQRKINLYERA